MTNEVRHKPKTITIACLHAKQVSGTEAFIHIFNYNYVSLRG